MDGSKRRHWWRFSLATMLFLMTCVCGYLCGYRVGYDASDKVWHYRQTVVKVYNVADLVVPPPNSTDGAPRPNRDISQLVDAIRAVTSGQPADECKISPFDANLMLIVNGNGVVHRRVMSLLEELRSKPRPRPDGEGVLAAPAATQARL